MSLYYRFKRWRGGDTITTVTRTETLYKYEVEHTNGDISTVYAHGYRLTEGFAKFWRYKDAKRWQGDKVMFIFGEIGLSKSDIRVLDSIKEIDHEIERNDIYHIVYDKADKSFIQSKTPSFPDA